jgi:hypothetical protein
MGSVIITSIVAFTAIILLLVFILLFAQSKLVMSRLSSTETKAIQLLLLQGQACYPPWVIKKSFFLLPAVEGVLARCASVL